jgi:cell wall-associated NlpC family hydrolase
VLEPQHEGIYIGDDRFIQAPHTGDVVKISSLAEPRYGFSYVGAVRP